MVTLFDFREDRFVGCKVGPHSCLYRHVVTIRHLDDVFKDRLLLSEFTHASSPPAFGIGHGAGNVERRDGAPADAAKSDGDFGGAA